MYSYTYQGLQPRDYEQSASTGNLFVDKLRDRLSKYTPSNSTVKRHVTLLLIQAMFIMSLAIFGMYSELKANLAEAESYELSRGSKIAMELQPAGANTENTFEGNTAVLGAETEPSNGSDDGIIVINDEEITPEDTDIAQLTDDELIPSSAQPPKEEYTIAVYGDSMVDTSGEVLEYLEHELKKRYPHTSFNLYNYGMGSNNVDDGIARWNKPFHHMDRSYPPITEIKPDIIIIGSFAYNVFTPPQRDHHWLSLTELVQMAQQITPNVYILAEIAPIRRGFGFGPNGVNWDPVTAYAHTGHIIEQLKNAIGLAETLDVPLIDAYTPSLDDTGREEGKRKYVNPSDGIHPSVAGHQFIAEKMVEVIELK